MRTLLIRADASAAAGTGHVMRCLALAQAWRATGGRALLAQIQSTPAIEDRVRRESVEAIRLGRGPAGSADDARETVAAARRTGADWVVGDGYAFGGDWQREIKESGFRLLLVDDYGHASRYWADIILNPAVRARPERYAVREPGAEVRSGPEHVWLRQEFGAWRTWQRPTPPVARRIVVTLGGSDPSGVTLAVLDALARVSGIEALVLVGGSNSRREEIAAAACRLAPAARLVVDAADMAELMAWAEVAVAAAGSTSWELAFMGLPSILLTLADNQIELGGDLAAVGVARCLARPADLDPGCLADELGRLLADGAQRRALSERGRRLVDGLGAQRTATRLQAALVRLRPAAPEDCRMVWDWSNRPEVRAASFSPEPIPWETHLRWYAAKMASDRCRFYIAGSQECAAFGQVRLELADREATISASIGRSEGKGWGAAMIACAARTFLAEAGVDRIHAYVKPANGTSLLAFEKAGFRPWEDDGPGGREARHLVLRRSDSVPSS